MFTGIVQKVGQVIGVRPGSNSDAGAHLVIDSGFTSVVLGESIAVNGVCLTVTEASSRGELFFFVSAETLKRSNLATVKKDSRVNLERALRAEDRLSGHLMQGHVDGQGTLARILDHGESHEARFEVPNELARYCVEKGSVALDGVSLTINAIASGASSSILSIMLIPHTWEHTNLSNLKVGDRVNVEVDVMAKYVEKLCQPYNTRSSS